MSTANREQRQPRAKTASGRALLGCGLALLLLGTMAGPAAEQRFVPGRLLVKTRNGVSEENFLERLKLPKLLRRQPLGLRRLQVLSLSEDKAEAALAALRADPDIEFVERDALAQAAYLPNDPYFASGSEWHLQKIQAPDAWSLLIGNTNTLVAVLDSGINAAHPDLAGRVLPGYDFVSGSTDTSDTFGHGTAVAGVIVAAGNNGIGVAGVAFGCRVLPVKVVDASGFASYSSIAQGIRYAVDNGARVINISIAGNAASLALQDAIDYAWSKNVLVIAAAGNNGNEVPQYPAACEHVLGVGATKADDSRAAFSSYGPFVTLAAPGDGIWTTQRDLANPYGAWRGTSFASPMVAAAAALLVSAAPVLPATEVVSILQQTAEDLGPVGLDPAFGHGRLNVYRALSTLIPEAPPVLPEDPPAPSPDTNPPSLRLTQAPPNGARLTAPLAVLAGTARDDAGIARVELQLNDGPVFAADGTTNWAAPVLLVPGRNSVRVRSVDWAGNVSTELLRILTYVVKVPLVVQTNGLGRVVPDLNGRELEIGRTYHVRAVPAAGQIFAGWTGLASESQTLTFVMQSNLSFTAHFVPTPFPVVQGAYAGLVAHPEGVTPENSGCFTLAVTSMGRFTGRMRIGGHSLPFSGRFNLDGDAVISLRRASQPLNVSLHVPLANCTDQVTGHVASGGWTSELSGDRNIFNARRNPAQQAGLRSFVLEPADEAGATAATGASRISRGGTAAVHGKLRDGRAFGTASSLARNGDCPFYLSLNRGNEIVIGRLNFPAGEGPTASGTVLWVKSGTNAFSATLQAASVQK